MISYYKQISFEFRFKGFQWDVRSFKFYRQRVPQCWARDSKAPWTHANCPCSRNSKVSMRSRSQTLDPLPTGEIMSVRYEGASPRKHLQTRTPSLYLILWRIGSQCG